MQKINKKEKEGRHVASLSLAQQENKQRGEKAKSALKKHATHKFRIHVITNHIIAVYNKKISNHKRTLEFTVETSHVFID